MSTPGTETPHTAPALWKRGCTKNRFSTAIMVVLAGGGLQDVLGLRLNTAGRMNTKKTAFSGTTTRTRLLLSKKTAAALPPLGSTSRGSTAEVFLERSGSRTSISESDDHYGPPSTTTPAPVELEAFRRGGPGDDLEVAGRRRRVVDGDDLEVAAEEEDFQLVPINNDPTEEQGLLQQSEGLSTEGEAEVAAPTQSTSSSSPGGRRVVDGDDLEVLQQPDGRGRGRGRFQLVPINNPTEEQGLLQQNEGLSTEEGKAVVIPGTPVQVADQAGQQTAVSVGMLNANAQQGAQAAAALPAPGQGPKGKVTGIAAERNGDGSVKRVWKFTATPVGNGDDGSGAVAGSQTSPAAQVESSDHSAAASAAPGGPVGRGTSDTEVHSHTPPPKGSVAHPDNPKGICHTHLPPPCFSGPPSKCENDPDDPENTFWCVCYPPEFEYDKVKNGYPARCKPAKKKKKKRCRKKKKKAAVPPAYAEEGGTLVRKPSTDASATWTGIGPRVVPPAEEAPASNQDVWSGFRHAMNGAPADSPGATGGTPAPATQAQQEPQAPPHKDEQDAVKKLDKDAKKNLRQLLNDMEAEDIENLGKVNATGSGSIELLKGRGGVGQSGLAVWDDCPGITMTDNMQGPNIWVEGSFWGPGGGGIANGWDLHLPYLAASWWHKLASAKSPSNGPLGPGANLWRDPLGGRSWEYLTGEDPNLAVMQLEAYSQGLKDNHGIGSFKHFLLNESEDGRKGLKVWAPMSAVMDMYLKPFVVGRTIGSGGVMCAYNYICMDKDCKTAHSACYSPMLQWLYKEGPKRMFVITDWGATGGLYEHRSAKQQIEQAGMITEYDTQDVWPNWNYDETADPDFLYRQCYYGICKAGGLVGKVKAQGDYRQNFVPQQIPKNEWPEFDKEMYAMAGWNVMESVVLLKNEGGVLPLKKGTTISLSGHCNMPSGDMLWKAEVQGQPGIGGGGSGKVIASPNPPTVADALRARGFKIGTGGIKMRCAWMVSSEGGDRPSAKLALEDDGMDESVDLVWLSTPGHIVIPWHAKPKAIVLTVGPGFQGPNGVAEMLLGEEVNPSAHLAFSIAENPNDILVPKDDKMLQYDGPDADGEFGYEVGYRKLQAKGKKPAFGFGFGLAWQGDFADFVTVRPIAHDLTSRSLHFCVTSNHKPVGTSPDPSPVVQFWVIVSPDRPYKQLLTFTKFKYLKAGVEKCRRIFYDPVAEWDSVTEYTGALYTPGLDFRLFHSLNGITCKSMTEWKREDKTMGAVDPEKYDRVGYLHHVWKRYELNKLETGDNSEFGRVSHEKKEDRTGWSTGEELYQQIKKKALQKEWPRGNGQVPNR